MIIFSLEPFFIMNKFVKIILFVTIVLSLSAVSFSQENTEKIIHDSKKCLVKVEVQFLKQNGYTGKIVPISNSCEENIELQKLAVEKAKDINFDMKIVKGEITDVIKPVEYKFAVYETKSPEIVETREQLVILDKPKVSYPSMEGGMVCFRGVVRLKVTFLSTGEIGDVDLVSGLPYGANKNSIEVAKKMKFLPMKINGVPITSKKTVSFNFNIY